MIFKTIPTAGLPEMLSLARVARLSDVDAASVRLALRRGRIRADAVSGNSILFRADRLQELRDKITVNRLQPVA